MARSNRSQARQSPKHHQQPGHPERPELPDQSAQTNTPPLPSWLSETQNSAAEVSAKIRLKVVPGARASQIVGPLGDRLKVRVAAPPEDGRANATVVELLARTLGLRTDHIDITAGKTNPEKEATVRSLTARLIQERITASHKTNDPSA